MSNQWGGEGVCGGGGMGGCGWVAALTLPTTACPPPDKEGCDGDGVCGMVMGGGGGLW